MDSKGFFERMAQMKVEGRLSKQMTARRLARMVYEYNKAAGIECVYEELLFQAKKIMEPGR